MKNEDKGFSYKNQKEGKNGIFNHKSIKRKQKTFSKDF